MGQWRSLLCIGYNDGDERELHRLIDLDSDEDDTCIDISNAWNELCTRSIPKEWSRVCGVASEDKSKHAPVHKPTYSGNHVASRIVLFPPSAATRPAPIRSPGKRQSSSSKSCATSCPRVSLSTSFDDQSVTTRLSHVSCEYEDDSIDTSDSSRYDAHYASADNASPSTIASFETSDELDHEDINDVPRAWNIACHLDFTSEEDVDKDLSQYIREDQSPGDVKLLFPAPTVRERSPNSIHSSATLNPQSKKRSLSAADDSSGTQMPPRALKSPRHPVHYSEDTAEIRFDCDRTAISRYYTQEK